MTTVHDVTGSRKHRAQQAELKALIEAYKLAKGQTTRPPDMHLEWPMKAGEKNKGFLKALADEDVEGCTKTEAIL